jgi:crotonobetainyl-CoA:carnitine CoA-transferase CaiB-like acyl-CoA transferase
LADLLNCGFIRDSSGEANLSSQRMSAWMARCQSSACRSGGVPGAPAIGNDQQWAALTALPRFAALARPEYAANAGRIADVERLGRELAACFADLTTDEALESLRRAGIPVSRVGTLADVAADPLIADRLVEITDPRSGLRLTLPRPPAGDAPALSFPPRLGEHNEKIYGEALGLSAERLAELRRRQIV